MRKETYKEEYDLVRKSLFVAKINADILCAAAGRKGHEDLERKLSIAVTKIKEAKKAIENIPVTSVKELDL